MRSLAAAVGGSVVIRFLLVGVVKVVIDFGVFNLVLLGAASPSVERILAANTAGFVVAGAATYSLHAGYTFRVATSRGAFTRYLFVSLVGLVLYNAVLTGLVSMAGTGSVVVLNALKVAALTASVGWNMFGAWRLVFRRPAEAERHDRLAAQFERSDAA